MIASTNPKLNRFKYAAMLAGAMAVAVTPLAYAPVATAQKVWDIEAYDNCTFGLENWRWEYWDEMKKCCLNSGGVWKQSEYKCVAPPAEPASGSRQFPGNVQIPSDIATAPVTKAPPRPIQVPSDIASAQVVTQAPA
jgi:hypothetical protein